MVTGDKDDEEYSVRTARCTVGKLTQGNRNNNRENRIVRK